MARGDRAKEITLSTRQITNTGDATRAFGEQPHHLTTTHISPTSPTHTLPPRHLASPPPHPTTPPHKSSPPHYLPAPSLLNTTSTPTPGEDPGLIIARPGRPVTNPFFFTVPEGFHALVSSWGRIVDYEGENGPTDCWPPGFHWGHPMTKVLYLVTQQAIVFDAPCRGVLTRDNVSISIDVAVVFRVLEKGESRAVGGGLGPWISG